MLDDAIDQVLDVLQIAESEGVELDPLATIIGRVQARGGDLSMDEAPPIVRMLLSGMLDA
jgi:hypothetical protein